jgi:hypothetical protein
MLLTEIFSPFHVFFAWQCVCSCLLVFYTDLWPKWTRLIRGRGSISKLEGHWPKGALLGTFVYDQNQTILWRSRAERKILKICSLYNVGNGLYRVFTTAKRAFSFQKRGRLFKKYFFRSQTAQKKGHFFHF